MEGVGGSVLCESLLWDHQLTVNTTDPDFTECFQQTALLWIPCGLFHLVTPYNIYKLRTSRRASIPYSWLNITKMVISICLSVVHLVNFIKAVVSVAGGEETILVQFITPVVVILTMIVSILVIHLERRSGVRSSGYMLILWLLLSIAGIVTFRSKLKAAILQGSVPDVVRFVTFYIHITLVLIQLVLSAFVDKPPLDYDVNRDLNISPERDASFLSKITFWWFTGMVIKGYKRALVAKDLWTLDKPNTSQHIVSTFERHWHKMLANHARKSKPTAAVNGAAMEMRNRHAEELLSPKPEETSRRKLPLLGCLIRVYAGTAAKAAALKLVFDIMVFVSPVLLKLMVAFIANPSEFTWHGYVYAVLLLVVAVVQTFILQQYFHFCTLIGLRLRTSIISAVYKKMLKLSTAARRTSTVGEIVNLMSVDAQKFMDIMPYLNMLWSGPFQIALCLYFLWLTLGPSVMAGLGVMVLLIPVNAYLASITRKLQAKQMQLKDERIKLMNEVLNGIKVLKLYAWELSFQEKVLAIRNRELALLRKAAYLNSATSFTWTCAPFMVSLVTFGVFVMISEENVLDAERAFVSLSLFNILRFPVSILPMIISSMVQASVSLKRLTLFLNGEELDPAAVQHDHAHTHSISVHNGSFNWDRDAAQTLRSIFLEVPTGSLVAIVGAVGCGKSSLLSAMLGEMEKMGGHVNVKGSVAYVSQQAWIQNATLQDNILFANSLSEVTYNRVLDACALRPDLEMLPAGDQTEIGEKGINLSGGQKQRVSLARAVYHDADIYLLDDPLSAVDAHVGKHIFDEVLGPNGCLKDKTRVLVTHSISYLPQVDRICVLVDGQVSESGTFQELIQHAGAFAKFLKDHLTQELEADDINEDLTDPDTAHFRERIVSELGSIMDDVDTAAFQRQMSRQMSRVVSRLASLSGTDDLPATPGLPKKQPSFQKMSLKRHVSVYEETVSKRQQSLKVKMTKDERDAVKETDKLIQTEAVETGRVKLKVFLAYIRAVGWSATAVVVFLYVLYNSLSVYSSVWLSEWSNDATNNLTDNSQRDMRLGVYGALGFLQGVLVLALTMYMVYITMSAAASLHRDFLLNIFRAPMRFYDITPLGRIINRFSRDIDLIDLKLPNSIHFFVLCVLHAVGTVILVSWTMYWFLVVLPPLIILYIILKRFYIATSRQLKRLESVSKSPVYSHFGETITGAVTIRAFRQQHRFIKDSEAKVDLNQMAYYPGIVSNRWLAVRLEILGTSIVFFAALFAVIGRDYLSPGIVGLSITYALNVTQTLNWMVRMTCELETNIISVERVKEYSETSTEAEWEIAETKPDPSWPSEGVVEFKDYCTRYREGLDLVLRGINCHINSKEKVGIVGRTGAGKSSITLSLFRIIESAGGIILIDGVNISEIGLHDLRSKLTIIPQDPVLFAGSLRMNLDPFDHYSDDAVWTALGHAHLKQFVMAQAKGLEFVCLEGGENLSVGQRQLVCLARALLRKTKILVLDEATAAVDLETDKLIQTTIRVEFQDCTILTIAHRLNTIMDSNRIMVLDEGRIIEFDEPQKLLQNTSGVFYQMAKDTGLVN